MEWLAFAALSSANLVGVFVAPLAPRGWERALLPAAFATCALGPAMFVPVEYPMARTVFAFFATGGVMRLAQIVRRPDAWDTKHRIGAMLMPAIDPKRSVWGSRAFHPVPWLIGVAELVVAGALFELARRLGAAAPYSSLQSLERTLIGGVGIYLLVDSVARQVTSACALFGMHLDTLHDQPILSRSVGEFWGTRWNRPAALWLQELAFRPVSARAGVRAGVMATFALSGLVHFIPIWIASNLTNAVTMGSFFVVQGGAVLVDSKLRISRLRPRLGWALTVLFFVATAPLFVEPMLESLGR